jgi:hypothetical protein
MLVLMLVAVSVATAQPGQAKLPEGTKVHRNLEYVKGRLTDVAR